MDIIFIIRLLITLTFLILAVGGPVAILQLRHFTRMSLRRYGEVLALIEAQERRITALEQKADGH